MSILKRTRPAAVIVLWSVVAAAALVVAEQLVFQPHAWLLRINSPIFRAEAAIGYLVGILYSSRMLGEFPRRSAMRRSWLLMMAGVACLFLYQTLDVVLAVFPPLRNGPTTDLWLLGISVSLSLLLLGMFGMWRTFRGAGLIPSLNWLDWSVVAAVSALTLARLAHGLEPHHPFANPIVRDIRGTGPLIVGTGAIIAYLLYRASIAFGRGQFSKAIQYLVIFFVTHTALFQLDWYPSLWDRPAIDAITDALYYALPWLLATGFAHWWGVSTTAIAIAERYQTGDAFSELEMEENWVAR